MVCGLLSLRGRPTFLRKYIEKIKSIAVQHGLSIDHITIDFSEIRISEELKFELDWEAGYSCLLIHPDLDSEKGISHIKEGFAKIKLYIKDYNGFLEDSFDYVALPIKDGTIREPLKSFAEEVIAAVEEIPRRIKELS